MHIRLAVRQLGNTGEVTVDAESRIVTVGYDPAAVSVDAIQEALEAVGYESTLVA